jgi:hypothetical protein
MHSPVPSSPPSIDDRTSRRAIEHREDSRESDTSIVVTTDTREASAEAMRQGHTYTAAGDDRGEPARTTTATP